MAFLRFTRDKRGYEHFQLVEAVTRRGRTRTRVLYWFRTPPGVKVGREPFDDETRRALEARNPNVAFDWKKILATPIPSADAEKWRERRREERAAKRARRAREAADGTAEGDEVPDALEASDTIPPADVPAGLEAPDPLDVPDALEPTDLPDLPDDDIA